MSAAYRDASGYGPVCGVGIYEPRVLCMKDSPEIERAYRVWNGMLRRAEPKYAAKHPTYAGTSVAAEFHRFADFTEWAMAQPGWGGEGYQLDKDLLVKGNRIYSPETCAFLPKAINVLLTRGNANRSTLPIGVKRFRHKQFAARLKIDGKDTVAGIFKTVGEAFAGYKAAKEANIRRLAGIYRERIDPRAYAALMTRTIDAND